MREHRIVLYLHEKTGKISDIKMEMVSKYDCKEVEIKGNSKKIIMTACNHAFDLGAETARQRIRESLGVVIRGV